MSQTSVAFTFSRPDQQLSETVTVVTLGSRNQKNNRNYVCEIFPRPSYLSKKTTVAADSTGINFPDVYLRFQIP